MFPFGVVESFLFAGFHETVHNTAFTTQSLNTIFAQLIGFFTFRGAKWYWCFHWSHHRFTNDPAKDPELSGGSVDLDDPTTSAWRYASFVSGYPFGFERVLRMTDLATGSFHDDPWVADKSAAVQQFVQIEAAVYLAGYLAFGLMALIKPNAVGVPVVLYWLLPHIFGAGHLRLYQFAEHRACKMGSYTDTNAWVCCRTTITSWLYRKLAWQMPYHLEHHAYPNVPFHKLEAAHQLIKDAYAKEGVTTMPTGCDPPGDLGYVGLHVFMFRKMLGNAAKAA